MTARVLPLVGLCALGLILPVLMSRGDVAVPGSWAVAGLAVLGVGAFGCLGPRVQRRSGPVVAAALGIAANHRLLAPGFPRGHDTVPHLWGSFGFLRAWERGAALPGWVHEIGLGMPLFLFYPPLPFVLLLPFHAIGWPVYECFQGAFVLASALAGLALYRTVRGFGMECGTALVAAGAYVYAPYHLLDSHYRGAIAEATALAVLPLFFGAWHRLLEGAERRTIRAAVVWTAVLALTHLLSLVMALVGVAAWALVRARPNVKQLGRVALLAAAVTGLGVGLAGFFTVPILAEGVHASIGTAVGPDTFRTHGLEGLDTVARTAWSELLPSRPRGAAGAEMPFYFGLVLLLLAAVGLGPGREPGAPPALRRGLAALLLTALALAHHPFSTAASYLPVLPSIQYPWRFLAVATCAAAFAAAFGLERVTAGLDGRGRRWARTIAFALIVFDAWPYTGAPNWIEPYPRLYRETEWGGLAADPPRRVDQLAFPPASADADVSLVRLAYPEYLTRETRALLFGIRRNEELARLGTGLTFADWDGPATRLEPAPYAVVDAGDGAGERPLAAMRGGGRIVLDADRDVTGTALVKEMWFPGWEAHADGGSVALGADTDGLMTFAWPAGARRVELEFTRSRWDRRLGIALSCLVLGGLLLSLRVRGS